MLDHGIHTGYHQLAVRLNRFPQGAPASASLYGILKILYSEREARLVSQLPIRVFDARKASRAWGKSISESRRLLKRLCKRALLIDIRQNGKTTYCLPPPMAGFFEFSLMRMRDDIDQKALARLFYRYINMEEDFAKALFGTGKTPLGRVYVDESTVQPAYRLEVMAHERTAHIIEDADAIGIGKCYCRHKMAHNHRACDAPGDICMTFNTTAASLIRHGHARGVEAAEALDILAKAKAHHLVQFGENVRNKPNFICNCCKCCCEGMIAARRFAMYHPVQTTRFAPIIEHSACTGCGQCADICPVEAIALTNAKPKKRKARIVRDLCLGCGVCANACNSGAISLKTGDKRVVTPLNTAHRVILMAIERDKLQHIIFDNQVLYSHRAMATLLGAIFKLPPVKRVMAAEQLQSTYLEHLVSRFNW